jgi:hypothetical protein
LDGRNDETVEFGFIARGRSPKRGNGQSVCAFLLPPYSWTLHLIMMIPTSLHFQLFLSPMMIIQTLTPLLHHIKREKLEILIILFILVERLVQTSHNSLLILVEILVQTSKNTSVHDIHGGIKRRNNHLSFTLRTNATMSLPVPRVKTCLLELTSVQLLIRG